MSITGPRLQSPRIAQEQPAGLPPSQRPIIVMPVAPPRGMSIASFVLGLVSIICGFVFLVPLLSVIFGIAALRKEPAGRGFAIAGLVMGGLILAVWVVIGLFFLTIVLGAAVDGVGAPATGIS